MTNNTTKKKIRCLVDQLNSWAHQYYVEDNPIVPDQEYDALYRELQDLEAKNPELTLPNSPTKRVGAAPRKEATKHQHIHPMLSLGNVFDQQSLQDFVKKTKKSLNLSEESPIDFNVEEKLDGLAINLVYENGILIRALTRGDGKIGELITDNAKTVQDIPLKFLAPAPKTWPSTIEIRGEIYMEIEGFNKFNQSQEKQNLKTFANPRNAAAGSIRLLNSKNVAKRPLRFFAYHLANIEINQNKCLEQLSKLGFKVNQSSKLCSDTKEIESLISRYELNRKNNTKTKYEIDGLVIKVNNFNYQQKLGFIAKTPKWAVAYKLAATEALTIIEDIIVQVGRTGALTPVACLKPVNVAGVEIKRATLHNQDQIDQKDIRIGDTVWIRRAGDVIPEIVRVVPEKRNANSKKYNLPKACPTCKTKTIAYKKTILCPSKDCPDKISESIKHFVSRKAMDIRGLGDQITQRFIKLQLICDFADIFLLSNHKDKLMELEGLGEKSVTNLLDSIAKSKKQHPSKLFFALGIEGVGETMAEELISIVGSLDKALNLTAEELESIDNVGPETAKNIFQWQKENNLLIKKLKRNGLSSLFNKKISTSNSKNQKLQNLKFVLTGKLSKPRSEIATFIKSNGGKVSSSISKDTDYLVCGEKAGSKLAKAQSLGVKVLTEEQLKKLI